MTTELFDFPIHEPPRVKRLPDRLRTRDAQVSSLDGYRPLTIDVDVPLRDGPVPLVVWVHGGAWRWGTNKRAVTPLPMRLIREELLSNGMAFAAVEYRLSAEVSWPVPLHDVKAAIRWVRHYATQLGVDPARIGVWGESAGGHLASLVATTGHRADLDGDLGVQGQPSDVAVCVNWYGPSDLTTEPMPELVTAFLGDPANAAAASPLFLVTSAAAPMLLIHGDADSLVPISDSERLADAYRAAGVEAEFIPVSGAGHAFAGVDPRPHVERSVQFLRSHLVS